MKLFSVSHSCYHIMKSVNMHLRASLQILASFYSASTTYKKPASVHGIANALMLFTYFGI